MAELEGSAGAPIDPPPYGVAISQTIPYDMDTLTERDIPIGLVGPSESTTELAKSFEAHIPTKAIEVEEDRFKIRTAVLDSLDTVASPEVAADLGQSFADVSSGGQIKTAQACMLLCFDLTSADTFEAAIENLEQMELEMCGTPHMLVGCKAELAVGEARAVGEPRAREIASRFAVEYIETSVARGDNVEYVFKQAARLVAAQMQKAGKDHRLTLAQGPTSADPAGGAGGGSATEDVAAPLPCASIAEALAPTLPTEPLPESEVADVVEVARQFVADAERDRFQFVAQPPSEVAAAEDGADFVKQIRVQTFRPEITSTPAALEAEVAAEYPTYSIQERAAQAHQAIERLDAGGQAGAAGDAAPGLAACAKEAYTSLRDGLNELAFNVPAYAAIPLRFQPETVVMLRTDQKASTQLRSAISGGSEAFIGTIVMNGEEVALLQLEGEWAEVQKADDAKSSGWVQRKHCVLRKMLQDTVSAEADELATLVESYCKFDPEPQNEKAAVREKVTQITAEVLLCKRRREAMKLLVGLRPVVEDVVKLNGEELANAETNLARDLEHKAACEAAIQAATERMATLAQQLEEESTDVAGDREHVASTIGQIEAGHVQAATALRVDAAEFRRNEREASSAISESVHGGAATKRGLLGTFDYLLRRAARQSRERNELLRKQAQHDARSRAVIALRADADKYVEWTNTKLTKLEGTKEAVAAIQRVWEAVKDRLALGYAVRIEATAARCDALRAERYEMLCTWIKNFTENVMSPAGHRVIIKHSSIAEAEAQVDEYDRALIPGVESTEHELDKAEEKLAQAEAELKEAEEAEVAYLAERKAYLEETGYAAVAEALGEPDVTVAHDERMKAEINQAKLRLGRTRAVVALETTEPGRSMLGSLQDAVNALDNI